MSTLVPNEDYHLNDLGSDFASITVETGDSDSRTVYIVVTDPLDFHENKLGKEITLDDFPLILGRIYKSLSGQYDVLDIDVQFSGDGESLEFSLYAGTFKDDSNDGDFSTLGQVVNYGWDFIATVNNLIDPGTFGCEYLFSFLED